MRHVAVMLLTGSLRIPWAFPLESSLRADSELSLVFAFCAFMTHTNYTSCFVLNTSVVAIMPAWLQHVTGHLFLNQDLVFLHHQVL